MGLDSVEFVMILEDHFSIDIPDTDAEVWETVGQVHEYLVERLTEWDRQVIWEAVVDATIKIAGLDPSERAELTPSTRFSDLNWD